MEVSNSETGVVSNRGWDWLRIALAVLLLTASALKGWQLATEPIIGTSLLESRWLMMATVEFEFFFGLWLLGNIWAKPSWAAALACFALFTCVSVCKVLVGYASCGCFGRVEINPWYTTLLDSTVVASLCRWSPTGSQASAPVGLNRLPVRVVTVFVIWLFVGIPAALAMWNPSVALLESDASVGGGRNVVVLKPEKWIGKRFPLLGFIDIGNRLKNGRWLVLICRCDCPRCQEVVRNLPQITRELDVHQVAVVEMAASKQLTDLPACQAITVARGRLNSAVEWFAELPVTSLLDDGTVSRAYGNRQPSIAWNSVTK